MQHTSDDMSKSAFHLTGKTGITSNASVAANGKQLAIYVT